jgi:hypothetical protein
MFIDSIFQGSAANYSSSSARGTSHFSREVAKVVILEKAIFSFVYRVKIIATVQEVCFH